MKHVVQMTYTKSTKNTHVYNSSDEKLKQLYVDKSMFDKNDCPSEIVVTVESK